MPVLASSTRDFPDVEKALTVLFEQLVDSPDQTGTVTPADFQNLPYLRVNRFGGPRDSVTDYASLDIEAFGATRTQAFDLLADALQLLEGEHLAGGVLLDNLEVTVGPSERPWLNGNIRRFSATVTVTARRQ